MTRSVLRSRATGTTAHSEPPPGEDAPSAGFEHALVSFREKGDEKTVIRWLDRELDREGVPHRVRVAAWWPLLAALADALAARTRDWPPAVVARAEGWVRAALRFSRPDGGSVFGDGDGADLALIRQWA